MTDSQDTIAEDVTRGPRQVIDSGDTRYTLLGTAHVSRASADEVSELIRSGEFDAVAIELCPARHKSLTEPNALANQDLFEVFRQGKAGMVAASLALGAFQQRVAEQSGIEPGAEMRAAVNECRHAELPLLLIDRDVGITLKRIYTNVPWWQRANLIAGLFGSLLSRQKVSSEEIERLKQGDVLESTFSEFAEQSETLYTPLISERDRYMALRLAEDNPAGRYRNVLVVIGAGHLKGLTGHLEQPLPAAPGDERASLEEIRQRSRWWKAIPWVVTALVLVGFAIGFSRDIGLGWQLIIEWFLFHGVLAGLGAAIALAHPLTIVATALAAPLTALNPTIGVGIISAGVEISLRRPKVRDFSRLRHDVTSAKGWWRNRVARTLLVFLLSTIGSAAGTWIAGLRIAEQLLG